jgi:hypothetical protein
VLGVFKRRFEPGMLACVKHDYNVYRTMDETFYAHSVVATIFSNELIIINKKAQDLVPHQLTWYHVTTVNAFVGYIMLHRSCFDERDANNVYV